MILKSIFPYGFIMYHIKFQLRKSYSSSQRLPHFILQKETEVITDEVVQKDSESFTTKLCSLENIRLRTSA